MNASLLWALSPINYLYIFFGLMKITLRDGKLQCFKSTSSMSIYSILFYVLTSAYKVYILVWRLKNPSAFRGSQLIVDFIITAPVFVTSFISGVVSVHFAPENVLQIINNIEFIDSSLSTDTQAVYSRLRKNVIRGTIAYTLISVTEFVYDRMIWDMSSMIVFWYMHGVFLDLISVEIIVFVHILVEQLASINRHLENLISADSQPAIMPLSNSPISDRYISELFFVPHTEPTFKVIYIMRLIRVYDVIADSVDILCSTYGLPILLMAISTFVNVLSVITSHVIFNMYTEKQTILYSFGWIIRCIWVFVLSAYKTARLRPHSAETSNIINRLATDTSIDPVVKIQLNRFLLLIQSRELDITICNIFVLDLSFLRMLVASIVSYGIIIMQSFQPDKINPPTV